MERTNLIDDEPGKASELSSELARRLAAAREQRLEPGSVELSPAELEQLKALGYVPR